MGVELQKKECIKMAYNKKKGWSCNKEKIKRRRYQKQAQVLVEIICP